ncbi:LysR family transcriptional regulator [Bacillus aquiflavi]|uniref:LysR family transcriptional regulator n=1 Tax=Bacillus aquiflavi TaxID=2672567 RepID=A0A6B3VVC9_9BACI|nr:LysR family transcriptional regulator [Bacillus aquiflavi]MBA4536575.1 LysR family transcriptional regulator [Bacillus aquiflavi]NEY80942.1 LysR family transcriptional regulator [Bacillus aquiflavi]UAC49657.1 LysR family transcriptional regulator [Bacillus aquiflavi]
MEIRHLKTFFTIVRLGSFTKAANSLRYAQSTITFHIQSIEEELGSQVFDRVGKKVQLTETGKRLLPYAKKILHTYKELKDATSLNGEIQGELVISASEALLIYRLPLVIKEFKEKYPKAVIHLKHLDPTQLKTELIDGEVDLAFLLDKERKEEGIRFERLVSEPMMLISKDVISLDRPDSMKDRVFLFTESGCSYRVVFEELIEQYLHLKETNNLQFWSIEALKQCVITGLGISILPYITVKNEIQQKKLQAQQIDQLITYIAFHKDKSLSPTLNVFLEILRNHTEQW